MTAQLTENSQSAIVERRRGACPTLGEPMLTGDGLLARLRPAECVLTTHQLRAIATAAADCGNGILEVTARGSLQIRGLQPDTVRPFERAVFDAGVTPATGLMVEVPPLAGIDPGERLDPRPIARQISRLVAERLPRLVLAPKLTVIVDGGGRFNLGEVTADIRLTAVDHARLLLATGGTNRSARRHRLVRADEAAFAVMELLEAVAALGPAARGRDLGAAPSDIGLTPGFDLPTDANSFLGAQQLPSAASEQQAEANWILGLALPYRQALSSDITGFLDDIDDPIVSDIRLSPGHGLILTGLRQVDAVRVEAAARRHGFWTSPQEPRANISLCAGKSGCASAHFDTRAVAEMLACQAPTLLDGSLSVHLSGCPKGCAHPSPAPLAMVGSPSGYGLIFDGAASDTPAIHIATNQLEMTLARLVSLLSEFKETDETARDCFSRLGSVAIAAVLRLSADMDEQ